MPERTIEQIWPPYALRVHLGPLSLRVVRGEDLPALIDLVEQGIHAPQARPFVTPWSTAPSEVRVPGTAAYHWGLRAGLSPQRWSLELVVRYDGQVVGVQGLYTRDFPVTRTGETGSWLGLAHQGRGVGTSMRQAMCVLAFDHLGAGEVTSAAFVDNPASRAVSRKVGYVENGTMRKARDGRLACSVQLRVTPETLVRPGQPVQVEGVEPLRAFLGLAGKESA